MRHWIQNKIATAPVGTSLDKDGAMGSALSRGRDLKILYRESVPSKHACTCHTELALGSQVWWYMPVIPGTQKAGGRKIISVRIAWAI